MSDKDNTGGRDKKPGNEKRESNKTGSAGQGGGDPDSQSSAATGKVPAKTETAAGGKDSTTDTGPTKKTDAKKPAGAETRNSGNPETPRGKKPAKPPRRLRLRGLFTALAALVIVAALLGMAGALYWSHGETRRTNAAAQALRDEVARIRQRLDTLDRQQQQVLQQSRDLAGENSALTDELDRMEQRLATQSRRLRALSSTTREDWLLAEAEYLVRLANQRVVVERRPETALPLLKEADRILRGLDAPDLTPVRRAIADDMAALVLAAEVDREGVYLRLGALADRVEQLPLLPKREPIASEDPGVSSAEEAASGEAGWWHGAKDSVGQLLGSLDDYIRVRHHDQPPKPLLPPDSSAYLQHNLRLNLQRAQLALMQENEQIYRQALQEARDWVQRYYPQSPEATRFLESVRELRQADIHRELPDLAQSMTVLGDYVERWHKMEAAGVDQESKSNGGEATP